MARSNNRPMVRRDAEPIIASGLYGFALYGLAMCNFDESVVQLLASAQARQRQGGRADPPARPAA